LPHHLQTSGIGWLLAAVVLIALAMVVFGRGMRGGEVVGWAPRAGAGGG
jgi:hypothetical protein